MRINNVFVALVIVQFLVPFKNVFAQSTEKFTYLVPSTYMKYNKSVVSVNYASALSQIKKNLDLAHNISCSQTISAEYSKKIEKERVKLLKNESKKYLVVIDNKDCTVMLTPYKGSESVMTDDLSSLDIFIIDLIPIHNLPKVNKIYIAIEKDSNGKPTGEYQKIICFEGEGRTQAEEQAKLIFKNKKYTIQTISISANEYGVITKAFTSSGELKMYFREFDSKLDAQKYIDEKTKPGKYSKELVELISLD